MSSKPKPRYKVVTPGTTPVTSFTNSNDKWFVLIGIDPQALQADGDSLTLQETVQGAVFDGARLRTFGVAADEIIIMLPRRILVPPNFRLNFARASGFIGVECASLEDALAIL